MSTSKTQLNYKLKYSKQKSYLTIKPRLVSFRIWVKLIHYQIHRAGNTWIRICYFLRTYSTFGFDKDSRKIFLATSILIFDSFSNDTFVRNMIFCRRNIVYFRINNLNPRIRSGSLYSLNYETPTRLSKRPASSVTLGSIFLKQN